MLTNKGYYIPKYLYRRKIELIRQKIIKRKYGYLFYKKTLSQVLPSQARKHYNNSLKKKYFRRWVLYWYKATVEWKLILRAKIHYKLSLQQRLLRRWKYFHIQRKTVRIKEQMALIHHQKNYTRQLKLFYVGKWKMFIKYKREKKRKLQFAWNYFKSKYKPEYLRPFFKRWKVLTKVTKKNKIKFTKAIKFFEDKLVGKVLTILLTHAKEKIERKKIAANAVNLHENKLLCKMIQTWLAHVSKRRQKRQDGVLAEAHYYFKLKLNCFRRILRNKNRNQFIRHKVMTITEWQHQRIKKCYFKKLRTYVEHRLHKRQKVFCAVRHYKVSLKKKILRRWYKYLQDCVEKRKIERRLLEKVTALLDIYLLRKCFAKWKKFYSYKRGKKHKVVIATCFHRKCILVYTFRLWTHFVSYKKGRREKEMAAIHFHNKSVKIKFVCAWKSFVKEEDEFKQKLLEAKNYYRRKLINEGLLIILKAGLNEKDERLKKSRDEIHHKLFLAEKYVSIWKQNVFYRNAGKETVTRESADESEEDKENIPRVSNFEWYQVCFLTPRLPKNYMDKL